MRTPVLETDRLILRPLRAADAEEVYQNWGSDPEVSRFMSWSAHENVEVTRQWLIASEANIDIDGAYEWGFERKSDHKLIGCGGIFFKDYKRMYELGYNIMKDCWHQGYTTEAARRILKFAVTELNQRYIYAYHAKGNPNSGKVMEKVGFYYIGDREYDSMDGTKHFEAREYLFEAKTNRYFNNDKSYLSQKHGIVKSDSI